jgi:hypothetical protein
LTLPFFCSASAGLFVKPPPCFLYLPSFDGIDGVTGSSAVVIPALESFVASVRTTPAAVSRALPRFASAFACVFESFRAAFFFEFLTDVFSVGIRLPLAS